MFAGPWNEFQMLLVVSLLDNLLNFFVANDRLDCGVGVMNDQLLNCFMWNFHLCWKVITSKRKSRSWTIARSKGFCLCWQRLRIWFAYCAGFSSAEIACRWSSTCLWRRLVLLLLLNWSNLDCVCHKLINLLLDLRLTQRRTKHSHIFNHLQAIIWILFFQRLVIVPLWFLVGMLLLLKLLVFVWFILLYILVKLIQIKLIIHQSKSVNALRWNDLLLL